MKAIFPKAEVEPAERLRRIVDFATRARHEGILSLESEVAQLDDPFMKKALQLAIDGNDPDAVAEVMRTEIRTLKARHKVAADWCMSLGIFAPTFGIIGAVIGLIATLGKLDQPESSARHLGRVRRHLLGRVPRQRHHAAAQQQAQADVDRGGPRP
jgi:chemotaxis protein MotA